MPENVLRQELRKYSADVVIVGGGPAGMHLTHELHKRLGSGAQLLLIEQANVFGGSGNTSMQQSRTFQSNEAMVSMIAATREWYDQVGHETKTKLLTQLPYLFIASDDARLSRYTQTLERVKEWGHGQGGETLTPEELRRRFPFIDREVVAGALYFPGAHQLNFSAALNYITKTSPRADFVLGTAMTNVRIQGGRVTGVDTSQGFVATRKVVLATGAFAIKTKSHIDGGTVEEGDILPGLIEVRKRQRFSAVVSGLPPETSVFVIGPGGEYVRLHTDPDGTGAGDYGYADPEDGLVSEPVIDPSASEVEFPVRVYSGLGQTMSKYGNDEVSGPLAIKPISGSRLAGYYTETKDNLPIICPTSVDGLFFDTAHSHAGVMTSVGAASHTADIVENGEQVNNLFGINRKFEPDGIAL